MFVVVVVVVFLFNTDAVTLLAGNNEYDISDHNVGGTLPVLCLVQTCLSAVTVGVRNGTGMLSTNLTVSGSSQDPQFNLDVTNNLQGEHHCHASFTVDNQAMTTSSMPFNITGGCGQCVCVCVCICTSYLGDCTRAIGKDLYCLDERRSK